MRLSEMLADAPRAPVDPPSDLGLFPQSSIVRRITAERVMLLGGPRALLMQIAHPMVSAAVADHSGFERDPWERLWGTVTVVLDVVFGDTVRAGAAASRVTALHADVVGERKGASYRALDPQLLLWVHATLVDSALVTFERFVHPLSRSAAERYYQEMKSFARAFRVPPSLLPKDLPAFGAYMTQSVASLEVGEEARRLAAHIVDPPVPWWFGPVRSAQRTITSGLLPDSLRVAYGFPWSDRHEKAFRLLSSAVRGSLPFVPHPIARWPHAHRE